MELSLSTTQELKNYIGLQLNNFFPDKYKFGGEDIDSAIDLALERTEYCFKYVNPRLPGYNENNQTFFSHLHSDQYSQFLFYLANSLWKISENKPICSKLVSLNKALNGIFVSYKCLLPDIFLFVHPIGTILGNAVYSDFLVVLQNVTVNSEWDEKGNPAPVLGKGLYLGTNSQIVGNMPIGDRVSVGVGARVRNSNIPSDNIVYRDDNGQIKVRERSRRCMAETFFNVLL